MLSNTTKGYKPQLDLTIFVEIAKLDFSNMGNKLNNPNTSQKVFLENYQ